MVKALFFENNLMKILAVKVASKIFNNAPFSFFSHVYYTDITEPPIPNSRWLKVKNICCGLCATDIHFIYMDMDPKCFPAAIPGINRKYLGHELIGKVVEIGKDVDGFAINDRVAMRIDWPSCHQLEIEPHCRSCKNGNYMLCENLGTKTLPIVDSGGGFSTFTVMHRTQAYKIPEIIDINRAVLIEPLSCAVRNVMKRIPKREEKTLIIGAGTIGLLTLLVVKAISPEAIVCCLVKYPFQADVARELGADEIIFEKPDIYLKMASFTSGRYLKGYLGNEILLGGFDIIYDTVGNDYTIQNALRWARSQGTVVLSGINFNPGKIDYSPIWNQEIIVTGINSHGAESNMNSSFDIAVKILSESKYPIENIITHRFSMKSFRNAVKTFKNKKDSQAIKIVLDHNS
ncbi:MAG: hypothetical protein C0403_04840 [Desulfobacterium sp.]|nr:hypothetical protein [Desulfobacterium sp.]